jgi:hypothetical protein
MRIAVLALTLVIQFVTLISATAHATTIRQMTFAGAPGDDPTIWVEDGITATGNFLDGYETPNSVHLDGFFHQWEQKISFTTGSLFRARSLDILSFDSDYCSIPSSGSPSFGDGSIDCDQADSAFDDPLPSLGITGYRDGALVARLALFPPESDAFETVFLDNTLGKIDRLVIEVLDHEELNLAGSCEIPCGHFNITNVTLQDVAPIPEPTGALLMGIGVVVAATCWPARRSAQSS